MKQKIIFGDDKIDKLRQIVESISPKKVLLLTGKGSYESSGSKNLIDSILKKYDVFRFYEFSINPKYNDVLKGVKLIHKIKPDLIISIGGGSVIDMGKQINILSNNNFNKNSIINKKPLKKPDVPLIAIPTTSGTGSESTSFSVIYIDGIKFSIENKYMLPNYAFIFPHLGIKMKKILRASCAFDGFYQAIESYWSINATKSSKNISSRSIRIFKSNLTKAMNGNEKSRIELFRAANLSGQAINITKTTAPHAISYVLSSIYGLQHGHAVAITLGKFFEYNMPNSNKLINGKKDKKYIKRTMKNLYDLMGYNNSKKCESYWYKTMQKVGLGFKHLGINKKSNINNLIKGVDANRLKNNPIKLDSDDLRMILDNL